MVLDQPVYQWLNNPLMSIYGTDGAQETPVVFPGNVTILRGTVLGEFAGAANDVQTFSVTGTPTAGSATFVVSNPLTQTQSNLVIVFNSTSAQLQTSLNAIFGTGNMTAGGGAWPATPLTMTAAGALVGQIVPDTTLLTNALNAGATPAVAHTTRGRLATQYAAYNNGAADGTEVAKLINKYTTTTDGYGNLYFGASATSMNGAFFRTMPAFRHGVFRTSDLIGLDAPAMVDLAAKFIQGTLANGIIEF